MTAALREIAIAGPDAFSLRGVARRAGVSAPAVYRHFKDKEDLLAAVAAECSDRIGALMREAVAHAPDDPLAQFRATGIAYVQFAVAHPAHFRALSVPGLFERTPVEQLERQVAWQANQRAALARAQAEGKIAALPLDDILLAASSLVHGLAQLIVEGKLGKVSEARARELAITVTGVTVLGFLPREGSFEDPLAATLPKSPKKPPRRSA